MRKTADADYEEMRDRLRVRAVGLMQQLDAAGYRAAIERDLAARARPRPAGDRGGRRRRRLRPLPDGATTADARFCKQCGAPLAGAR